MNKSPLISVVIPTCNRCAMLARAIASVQRQNYQHWQLIVVDDASEDDTAAFLEKIRLEIPSAIVRRLSVRRGAAVARNIGIDLAQGEFITFLDDDDEWLPDHLQRMIETAYTFQVQFVFTHALLQNDQGRIRPTRFFEKDIFTANDLALDNLFGGFSRIMVAAGLAKDVRLDEDLLAKQDYDFYLRLLDKIEAAQLRAHTVKVNCHRDKRISTDFEARINSRDRILTKHQHRWTPLQLTAYQFETEMFPVYYGRKNPFLGLLTAAKFWRFSNTKRNLRFIAFAIQGWLARRILKWRKY